MPYSMKYINVLEILLSLKREHNSRTVLQTTYAFIIFNTAPIIFVITTINVFDMLSTEFMRCV